jgi:outer membrane receptor protein involved in Fe transport
LAALPAAFIVSLLSTSAMAQVSTTPAGDAPAAADEAGSDIVVTGTRIRRPDLQSNSPLTVVGAQEIQYQGATAVESVLARLPQVTADANENVSNGSDGTSNVNLRGLGANRVLILLNGQRLLPQQAVDLNFVPSALVERVDVVTGGASAVYGSDALSGVINFVLRDNLDGFRADAQTGFAQHDNGNDAVRGIVSTRGYALAPRRVADGGKQDLNIAYGKNFAEGRGNVTFYAGYRHYDPVLQSDRDVSSCALQGSDALTCGGSSNTPYGTFVPLAGPNQGVTLTNAKDGTRTWVPYDSSFAYNYAPTNYFQRSDQRITTGAFAKFKFSPAAEAYGSFMFMRDRTYSQVAPSALFLGTPFDVSCNSPLLSASQATALCGTAAGSATTQSTLIGYRLALAPRRDNLRHTDYRWTAGLRGQIARGFSYDVNYLHSQVNFDETYMNNVDNVKAQRALDVVSVNGVPTCRSVVDGSDPACLPVNVFQANGVTAAQGSYLFSQSNTASRNRQTVFSGTVTGDFGEYGVTSPWASHGVSLVLGGEHRVETLKFTADAIAKQGGTTDSDGRIRVIEGYGELEVPLVEDRPFVRELTLNGAARYSAYHNSQASTGFESRYNAFTYKGEVTWKPVDMLRARASFNHAFRAPNITELFASQSIGNVSAQDPCGGTTPAASAAACTLSGVTAAQYGRIVACPSDTCSALSGGNRNVKPETGNTYTVGLVLTPRQMRNFSLSVDYYNIKVKDYINAIDSSLIIDQCTNTGNPFFCSLFKRDPRSGAIFGTNGYIVSTTVNTGFLKTSGIDVAADYSFAIGAAGRLNLNLVGSYLINRIAQPVPGLDSYDCKGKFGSTCGQPAPEWRHVARTTWTLPNDATLSLSWRYLGSVQVFNNSSVINSRIAPYHYFDLAATVPVTKAFQMRAGVNNLFDKDPPAIAAGLLASFGNGNTYPGVYDVLGRSVFVGATVNF